MPDAPKDTTTGFDPKLEKAIRRDDWHALSPSDRGPALRDTPYGPVPYRPSIEEATQAFTDYICDILVGSGRFKRVL